MSIAAGEAGRRLDIGAAVSDALNVIHRRWPRFLVASVLLVLLPQFLSLWLRYASRGTPLLTMVVGLIVFILSLVLQGGLLYATTRELDGEATEVGDMLRAGFRTCVPLCLLTLIVGIASELGLALLIVPGVLLFLRWCMAGPAMVAEKLGVFSAMRRSVELTKGRRWALFLAYLVIALVVAVIEGVFITLAGGFDGLLALTYMQVVTPYTLFLTAVVSPVIGVLFSVSFGVFSGALFHQLRTGREGARTAALAEVFA